jgi:hypothetical protein
MLPDALWQEELLDECKSRRSLMMKLLLPLILIGPLSMGFVPAAVRSGAVAMVVIFMGIFGSSIGIAGWKDSKMLERLAVLPVRPAAVVSDYILARSLFVGVQLAIPLALILYAGRSGSASIPWILICFIAALVSATALGVLVSLAAHSSGEVHLYAFLAVIIVAGLSGIFPGTGLIGGSSLISPFWQLSNTLLSSWGASELQMPALSLISGAMILLTALLVSPRLFKLD